MRRFASLLAVSALSLVLLGGAGCQKKIEVQTGSRVVCTYGETVSDNVKTIAVPANKAGAYRIDNKTITCDRHKKLEALYAAAQTDIANGDLTAAKVKLTQVIASDSAFGNAQQQLDSIAAGKKPKRDAAKGSSGGSAPATSTPKPGDDAPTGPVESMLKWAPDTLSGFTASAPAADALSFSRQYIPDSGSKVASLVVAAEQFRTSASAKAALQAQVKSPYPANSSNVNVNGRSVYFGTDGRRFSIIGFTQGTVLVLVEMSAKPGDQATLKSPLVAVVKQMP